MDIKELRKLAEAIVAEEVEIQQIQQDWLDHADRNGEVPVIEFFTDLDDEHKFTGDIDEI